ncbi:hypothetical protein TNCV_285031 [Trichonephila clavipes]|nr:hypothetical protein TNCV_285031 [Trichonephila clavipes]
MSSPGFGTHAQRRSSHVANHFSGWVTDVPSLTGERRNLVNTGILPLTTGRGIQRVQWGYDQELYSVRSVMSSSLVTLMAHRVEKVDAS